MPRTIISDTSCLIVLTNIGELKLLYDVYGKIITTNEVAMEFGETLPNWIQIADPKDQLICRILELMLDKGEASAIALALEIPDSTVILDDDKARKVAEKLGLELTGTLGVIVKAKLTGKVNSLKPYLSRLKSAGFRLSEELEKEALKEAGEKA